MTLYDIIFYFFAVMTLVSACIVAFSKNIIYSAFSLLITFFGVAGIYVLLNADFIAVAQILIYVGGIMVLVLFGVMLTNRVISVDLKTGTMQTLPASILVAMFAGVLCGVFYSTEWKTVEGIPAPSTTADSLGELFMTTFALPFEVASIILLVALLGAALIARKDRVRLSKQ